MKATKIMPTLLGLPLLIATALGTTAQAAPNTKSYVLTASSWGPTQDAVVAKAGGTITYKHSGAGIATVESSNKNFLKDVKASGGINGAEDQVVQWQRPSQTVDMVEQAVTFGDDAFINAQWALDAVQAKDAWAAGFDGAGVRVAVIDGGIYNVHPDLAANIDVARSTSFVPGFAYNQDTGTFWHGTHVAGIIAAVDNTIGVVGIAPKATIVGVKALHAGSGSFGQVISAILYAATPIADGGGGADIINMSLGALFPRGGGNTGAGQLVGAMASAVNYATDQNVLVVSSAGNDAFDLDHSGNYIDVPAQSGSGIAVSATGPMGFAVNYPNGATDFDRPASYTNYGKSAVWVAGPGGDFALPGNANCAIPAVPAGNLVVPCWAFDMVLSTSRTGWTWSAGTSMSAPAASAVAALIKQRFPGIAVGDLKSKLAQSAVPGTGEPEFYGKGMINAYNAVTQ